MLAFEADIEEQQDSYTIIKESSRVFEGTFLGWALINDTETNFTKFVTKNEKKILVTPAHLLWIKRDSSTPLVRAERVNVGDMLPIMNFDDQSIQWEIIREKKNVVEPGAYDPLIIGENKDDVGDCLVTGDGLVVPIYATGTGVSPIDDHKIFINYIRSLKSLEEDFPCLFNNSLDGSTQNTLVIAQLLREFEMEFQTKFKDNPELLEDEKFPDTFFELLKEKYPDPNSNKLRQIIALCPKFENEIKPSE